MKKQIILDLLLKSEKEVMEISLDSPLIMRGRAFLRRIPSYKMDSLIEKSSDEMLSNLISFFYSLLKREDIPPIEKEKIRSFINVGKIERLEREKQGRVKHFQKIEAILKELHEILCFKTSFLNNRISSQQESMKAIERSLKNYKLIIFFLSMINCVESTAQVTISIIKKNSLQAKAVIKAIISSIIACWTGYSICKKKK